MGLINTFTKSETGTVYADAYHRVAHPFVDEAGPDNNPPRKFGFLLLSYSSKENRDAGLGAEYTAQFKDFIYDMKFAGNIYDQAYSLLKSEVEQLKDAKDA